MHNLKISNMSISNKPFKVNMNYLNDKIHESVYTIDELLNEVVPFKLLDQEVIDQTYILELESLLTHSNVNDLARSIVSLERKLVKLSPFCGSHIVMPELSSFYLSLSPVFLQTLCEEDSTEEINSVKSQWLKAIRIALEEEIASWQEK